MPSRGLFRLLKKKVNALDPPLAAVFEICKEEGTF